MSRELNVNWRVSPGTAEGWVQYQETAPVSNGLIQEKKARLRVIRSPELRSDNLSHTFAATMDNLKPGAAYCYRVGANKANRWSAWHTFTAAPENNEPFSFVFFGDTQKNIPAFGRMISGLENEYPGTAFYLIGGDLVENGGSRNLWDEFMIAVGETAASKPLAPAIGNHDYKNGGQSLFSAYFNLPANGRPGGINYSFSRQNVWFIVLDSNKKAAGQNKWLKDELKRATGSGARFIIAMFHHPPYNSKNRRGQKSPARRNWMPLFDEYGVDLVLNGHDHSYLRSQKIRGGQPVKASERGTVYVMATACEKFYDWNRLKLAEVQFGHTTTYQRITVAKNELGQDIMRYQAFSAAHELKDEFILVK